MANLADTVRDISYYAKSPKIEKGCEKIVTLIRKRAKKGEYTADVPPWYEKYFCSEVVEYLEKEGFKVKNCFPNLNSYLGIYIISWKKP